MGIGFGGWGGGGGAMSLLLNENGDLAFGKPYPPLSRRV